MKPSKPPRGALAALAQSTGIPYTTLSRWRREGTDIYNPAALAERQSRIKQAPSGNLTEARLQKIQAETRRIELAYQVERGRFVSADVVRAEGIRIGRVVREHLDRLARQDLPPLVAGRSAAEISVILRRVFNETLISFSHYNSKIQFDENTDT